MVFNNTFQLTYAMDADVSVAWLLREAGSKEECAQLLSKLKNLPSTTEIKVCAF